MLDEINRFVFCLVVSEELCRDHSLEKVIEDAVEGGVNMVQLREKNATASEIISLGKHIKKLLDKYSVPLIINDRVDIAVALDADGVHLGQSDLPWEIAREILGSKKIIGLSANNIAQVKQANNYEIDYLGVGPIFPTKTKLDATPAWDFNDIKSLTSISSHCLVGIGGISAKNVAEILGAGFHGIAVASAICSAENPKQLTEEICKLVRA